MYNRRPVKEWVLGIDIGGTTLKAALVRRDGTFGEARSKSSRLPDRDSFRRALQGLVRELDRALPSGARLSAVGIGCKGTIARGACRVRTLPGAFRYLEGAPLDAWIVRALGRRGVAALGAALSGIASALDPELFLLGGQIAEAGRALFAPLRRDLDRRTARLLGRRIPIRRAALGERAGVAGAAALGWDAVESKYPYSQLR